MNWTSLLKTGWLMGLLVSLVACAGTEVPTPPVPGGVSSVGPAAGAMKTSAVANLRAIHQAQTAYTARIQSGGTFGTFRELCAAKLLNPHFDADTPSTAGFTYHMDVGPGTYKCVARGQGVNQGVLFVVNEKGLVCSDEACTIPVTSE